MSISLILIGVISLIVIAGTAYLLVSKNEQLGDSKKSNILLIVGIVIFVSFIVTSMKHPSLHRRHTHSAEEYDLNSIFFPKDCEYNQEKKYVSNIEISSDVIHEVYARNYLSVSRRPQSQESNKEQKRQNIIFLSKKDQGASYFLSNLAQTSCKSDHPTLYFKLKQDLRSDKQFAKAAGFYSYQELQQSICQLSGIQIKKTQRGFQYLEKSKNSKLPYVIIDNFQHLISALSTEIYSQNSNFIDEQNQNPVNTKQFVTKERLITKIITSLMNKCKANLILNSESQKAIQELLFIWEQGFKSGECDLFPLQFHQWQGLKRYDIYKIIIKAIPNSDYILNKILQGIKKDHYTFNDLNNIVREIQRTITINNDEKNVIKRQDANLRQTSIKIGVARYFGLGKPYKQIRSSEKKTLSFLKQKVSLNELWRLEALNLISIRNGNICIQ